jgi:hypothetical protein
MYPWRVSVPRDGAAMELTHRDNPPAPWTSRALAGLGFLLAALLVVLAVSRHLAMTQAQSYLQSHYRVNLELPVQNVRPHFLTGSTHSGRPLPPLGFCWAVELDVGTSEAEVMVNPWTHEIVDWDADL